MRPTEVSPSLLVRVFDLRKREHRLIVLSGFVSPSSLVGDDPGV